MSAPSSASIRRGMSQRRHDVREYQRLCAALVMGMLLAATNTSPPDMWEIVRIASVVSVINLIVYVGWYIGKREDK